MKEKIFKILMFDMWYPIFMGLLLVLGILICVFIATSPVPNSQPIGHWEAIYGGNFRHFGEFKSINEVCPDRVYTVADWGGALPEDANGEPIPQPGKVVNVLFLDQSTCRVKYYDAPPK